MYFHDREAGWRGTPGSYDSRRRNSPPRRRSRSRERYRPPARPRSRTPPPRRRSPTMRRRSRSRSPPMVQNDKSRVLQERMEFYRPDLHNIKSRKDLVDFLWRSGTETLPECERPTLFNEVVSVKLGIVGVDSLYQVVCGDKPSFETYYCSMCQWWTTASDMFGHLVSYPHRLAHLYRNYPSLHQTIMEEEDMRKRTSMAAYLADGLSKTEGCGQVLCRLRCILSMKTISRLWPDYEMYVDNAWKLTDITTGLIQNRSTAFDSAPPSSFNSQGLNPWESAAPPVPDPWDKPSTSRRRRSRTRSRSRSPPVKRHVRRSRSRSHSPRQRRRTRSRSRSRSHQAEQTWEEKAASFLNNIGAKNEAKRIVAPINDNPHRPPGVEAHSYRPSTPPLNPNQHDLTLDERLQYLGMTVGLPQPVPPPMMDPMGSSPMMDQRDPSPTKPKDASKGKDEDTVGMRKLLGFMVTLQQEIEERGHVDNEAMKKLCNEMGIREDNLEKAYSMLNDLSQQFGGKPGPQRSPKNEQSNGGMAMLNNFQGASLQPGFEYGQQPSTSSAMPPPPAPPSSVQLENLGLSAEKLRDIVTQAQQKPTVAPPAPMPMTGLPPPPVPPPVQPPLGMSSLGIPIPPPPFNIPPPPPPFSTSYDNGGYNPALSVPQPQDSFAGFESSQFSQSLMNPEPQPPPVAPAVPIATMEDPSQMKKRKRGGRRGRNQKDKLKTGPPPAGWPSGWKLHLQLAASKNDPSGGSPEVEEEKPAPLPVPRPVSVPTTAPPLVPMTRCAPAPVPPPVPTTMSSQAPLPTPPRLSTWPAPPAPPVFSTTVPPPHFTAHIPPPPAPVPHPYSVPPPPPPSSFAAPPPTQYSYQPSGYSDPNAPPVSVPTPVPPPMDMQQAPPPQHDFGFFDESTPPREDSMKAPVGPPTPLPPPPAESVPPPSTEKKSSTPMPSTPQMMPQTTPQMMSQAPAQQNNFYPPPDQAMEQSMEQDMDLDMYDYSMEPVAYEMPPPGPPMYQAPPQTPFNASGYRNPRPQWNQPPRPDHQYQFFRHPTPQQYGPPPTQGPGFYGSPYGGPPPHGGAPYAGPPPPQAYPRPPMPRFRGPPPNTRPHYGGFY